MAARYFRIVDAEKIEGHDSFHANIPDRDKIRKVSRLWFELQETLTGTQTKDDTIAMCLYGYYCGILGINAER